eukprot:scaffold34618_cov159-Amphora_coffeaeformis.AAC.1
MAARGIDSDQTRSGFQSLHTNAVERSRDKKSRSTGFQTFSANGKLFCCSELNMCDNATWANTC